jgi:tetratricopeptide (TPR) repeat protein
MRTRIFLAALVFCAFCFGQNKPAPYTPEEQAIKTEGYRLYDEGKMVQALEKLKQIGGNHLDDPALQELWGCAEFGASMAENDPVKRKEMRRESREIMRRASEMIHKTGRTHTLADIYESVPEDGSDDRSFSESGEADKIMKEGEALFSKGDLEEAITAYRRALALDPKNYWAALFIGDSYYKNKKGDDAGKWFQRAIEIDPNRETAYRYWGDVLKQQEDILGSRNKFIDAVVAEPNRNAWVGLIQWGEKYKVHLSHPKFDTPEIKENGDSTITIPPDDKESGAMIAWMAYVLTRNNWKKELFAKTYPQEKQYRHSLAEEAGALTDAAKAAEQMERDQRNAQIQSLIRLDHDGLIEAYVLFARSDEGIAQDYAAYREHHRDKLRQYLEEWVAPMNASKAEAQQ